MNKALIRILTISILNFYTLKLSLFIDVDQFKKKCLLNGLDDIELTMKKFDKIKSFEDSYFLKFPWLGQ